MIPPVELHGVIQRSHEVTQIKANEDARPEHQQDTIVQNQEKEVAAQHETVVKKDNADKNREKYDAKEKGKGTYYKIRKKKQNEEKEDGVIVKKTPSYFDVKI